MVTWPDLLTPTRPVLRFTLQNPTRSGGVALNGQEQVIYSAAERWQAKGAFYIRGREAALQFESFLTAMGGRSGVVAVPTFSGRFVNWPVENGVMLTPRVARDPGLDGTVYQEPGINATGSVPAASVVSATIFNALAVGDTSCEIIVSQGGLIQAGQLFGFTSNHVHRAITASEPFDGAQVVTFRPKVRVSRIAGSVVRVHRPLCDMRFASDDEGQDFDGWGGPVTMNFVEAF